MQHLRWIFSIRYPSNIQIKFQFYFEIFLTFQMKKSYLLNILQNRTVRWNGLLGPTMDTRWVSQWCYNVHFHFPSWDNNRQKVLWSMCRYGRRAKIFCLYILSRPFLTDCWHLQQTFKRICFYASYFQYSYLRSCNSTG